MEKFEVLQDVEWTIAGKQNNIETAVKAGTEIPKCTYSLGKTKTDGKGCLIML